MNVSKREIEVLVEGLGSVKGEDGDDVVPEKDQREGRRVGDLIFEILSSGTYSTSPEIEVSDRVTDRVP